MIVHDLHNQISTQAKRRLCTTNPHKDYFYPWSLVFQLLNFITATNLLFKGRSAVYCGGSETQVHSHLCGFPSVTDGHPCSRAFAFQKYPPSTSTNGLTTTFESISAAGMGIDRQVSFSLLMISSIQSEQGLCRALCHLLVELTQVASAGVNWHLNSSDHSLISRGMGMTFWQKRGRGIKGISYCH